jgi:hypothetical protein
MPATLKCLLILAMTWLSVGGCSGALDGENRIMRVKRLVDRPIITPGTDDSLGDNIQGPSLIRVPDWFENPLGKYYLYFADHKGQYIRMAYGDNLVGPWKVYKPGALHLDQSHFLREEPVVPAERVEKTLWYMRNVLGDDGRTDEQLLVDLTIPHIASPDVHVDHEARQIVMYFHGLDAFASQVSRVALSSDGISFKAQEEILGRTYMRAFSHEDQTYVLAMPGQLYRSKDGVSDFEEGPKLFEKHMRHNALLKRGDTLHVFWTRVGDAPESVLHSTIDISGDWMSWTQSVAKVILKPEYPWEGADAPLEPSKRSSAYGKVNQLRDPAIFEEDGQVYLLYAVAGESGIAIAQIEGLD